MTKCLRHFPLIAKNSNTNTTSMNVNLKFTSLKPESCS